MPEGADRNQPFDSLHCQLSGVHLVEAAAGTGKTYNIQNLAVRLILQGQPVESIVIVTFTKAATAELKGRILQILSSTAECAAHPAPVAEEAAASREEQLLAQAESENVSREECRRRLRRALMDFDRAAISTIHGFCTRLLRDYAFESGKSFGYEITCDDSALIREFALDVFRRISNTAGLKEFFPWEREAFCTLVAGFLAADRRAPDGSGEAKLVPAYTGGTIRGLYDAMQQNAAAVCRCCKPGTLTPLPALVKQQKEETLAADEAMFRMNADCGFCSPQLIDAIKKYAESHLRAQCRAHQEERLTQFLAQNGFFRMAEQLKTASDQFPVTLLVESAAEIAAKCRARKEAGSVMSNDDLIAQAAEALGRSEEFRATLRNKLTAGIVDEFQDTDPLQYWIFRTLFGSGNQALFLVGDPRQAIYKFRGGDLYAYLGAAEGVPAENRATLSVNYRSTGGLIAGINTIFGGHPNAFRTERFSLPEVLEPEQPKLRHAPLMHHGQPDTVPLVIASLPGGRSEFAARSADLVAEHLDGSWSLPDGRVLSPADFAVLAHSWLECKAIKAQLQERGIKAVVLQTDNIFSTADAAELQTFLGGVLSPGNYAKAARALCTPVGGCTPADFFRGGNAAATLGAEILLELHKLWHEQSFAAMFRRMTGVLQITERYSRLPDGERKLTSLIQLGDLLHEESLRSGASPEELLHYLHAAISGSSQSSQEHPQPMESDRSAVRILTMHHSKGLQYPVVILPSLDAIPRRIAEDVCTYHDDGGSLCIDIAKSAEGKRCAQQEAFDEALRLAYVAMTRAEYRCIILTDGSAKSALHYLLCERDGGEPIPGQWCITLPEHSPMTMPRVRPESVGPLQPRSFHAPEQLRQWRCTSFSDLAPAAEHDPMPSEGPGGSDEIGNQEEPLPGDPLPRLGGKNFGTAFHSIMEQLDYTIPVEAQKSLFSSAMVKLAPSAAELAAVQQLVTATLTTPLPDGFVLNMLERRDRCCELRFDYGFSGRFERNQLLEQLDLPLPEKDPGDEFCGGVMTGSIDLLYRHDGKYHLIDWKTNRLGDYTPATLARVMTGSFYQLQLQLYVAALVRYLALRLHKERFTAADYENFVGTATYVFVRGVGIGASGNGFYTRRPAFEEIQATMELLQ